MADDDQFVVSIVTALAEMAAAADARELHNVASVLYAVAHSINEGPREVDMFLGYLQPYITAKLILRQEVSRGEGEGGNEGRPGP